MDYYKWQPIVLGTVLEAESHLEINDTRLDALNVVTVQLAC